MNMKTREDVKDIVKKICPKLDVNKGNISCDE